MGKKRKKKGSKAISISLGKWIYLLGFIGYTFRGFQPQGLLQGDFSSLTVPLDNLKQNWWLILVGVGMALMYRVFGRWLPRAGIKGALSVRP